MNAIYKALIILSISLAACTIIIATTPHASATFLQQNITINPVLEVQINRTAVATYEKWWSYNMPYFFVEHFTAYPHCRAYQEWNFSHDIPLDSYISWVNLSYYSFQAYFFGNDYFAFGAPKKDVTTNHLNSTSAANIWPIYRYFTDDTGSGYVNPYVWFAGYSPGVDPQTPRVKNVTVGSADATFYHHIWYIRGTTGTYRQCIYEAIEQNCSNTTIDAQGRGEDYLVTAIYAFGGSDLAYGCISAPHNASSAQQLQMTLNVTYNVSDWNSTQSIPFSNNSQQIVQPTVYFDIKNDNGSRISYSVWVKDNTTGIWTETYFCRNATNGTQSVQLSAANIIGRTYWWNVSIVGNSTHLPIYNFSVGVDPPANLTCHDYNSTVLNFSFNPYNNTGTSHTVCYYQQGSTAPMYGTGTLGGNLSTYNTESLKWINITGLSRSTTYTFAFWTYYNVSDATSPSGLSTNYSYRTNTTYYGEVTISLRHENISDVNTNPYINLSHYYNSTHRLLVHYANLSADIVWWDSPTYNSSGYLPVQTVMFRYQPVFYEFTWNYTVVGSNKDCEYTRILTPYAEETSGSTNYLTFYLLTDRRVYNQYYLYGGDYNLTDDISNNLVEYSYLFDDRSNYFTPSTSYEIYATIYKYNATKQIIIDQRYIDSSGKIGPTLLFEGRYYIGVATITLTTYNPYYENLGLLSTERVTSPYTENVIIYQLPTYYSEVTQNITAKSMYTATGFWYLYSDSSLGTQNIQFSVYNFSNGSLLYVEYQNSTSSHNFTYATIDPWHPYITYKVLLNFTYRFEISPGIYATKYYSYLSYVYPPIWHLTPSADYVNYILEEIFGPSPFKNPNPSSSYTMPYFDIIMLFGGLFLGMFLLSQGSPGLAGFATGFFYAAFGSGALVTDVSPSFIVLGIFIIITTLIYLLFKGGLER